MNSTSYAKNYYSIADIMVTHEKIPCVAETDLLGMGELDSTFDHANVSSGEKLELPLWYALEYRAQRLRTLKFQVPDIFKSRLKDICEADALAVDLGRLNKYFYTFGQYIVPYDVSGTVSSLLYNTCRARCRALIDLSKDLTRELKSAQKFEHIESEMYLAGCATNEAYSTWLKGRASLLEAPNLVKNHQKRRRAHLDGVYDDNPRLSKSPRI